MKNLIKKQLFDAYDRVSDEASGSFLDYIEAKKKGQSGVANYIKKNIYAKLNRRSNELFDKFKEEISKS